MDQNLKTQLIHSIYQFKKIMSSEFRVDATEDKNDVNMTELILMNEIADNTAGSENNIGMSDVSKYLSVSKAAISNMLSSLEKKGYINREIDRSNRRNLIVTLTPEGRKILEFKYMEFNGMLEKVITRLGEDDANQLITILNRMTEIMHNLNSEAKQEQEK